MGLKRNKLRRKIITELNRLRAKSCSYVTDDGDKDENEKDREKCIITWKLKFEDYKHCLELKKTKKLYENHCKDLESRNVMSLQKKLTRLHWLLMMIKECNQLVQ